MPLPVSHHIPAIGSCSAPCLLIPPSFFLAQFLLHGPVPAAPPPPATPAGATNESWQLEEALVLLLQVAVHSGWGPGPPCREVQLAACAPAHLGVGQTEAVLPWASRAIEPSEAAWSGGDPLTHPRVRCLFCLALRLQHLAVVHLFWVEAAAGGKGRWTTTFSLCPVPCRL